MDEAIANKRIHVLIGPDFGGRSASAQVVRRRYSWIRTVLAAEHWNGLYRNRCG
jgi:hypothetical protein